MDLDSRTLARELRIAFSRFSQARSFLPLVISGRCSSCLPQRASPALSQPYVSRLASTSPDDSCVIAQSRPWPEHLLQLHLFLAWPGLQIARPVSRRFSAVSFPFLSFSAAP